jgi:hypothetical protein
VVLLIDTVDVDFCNNDMLCNADVARMLIYMYMCVVLTTATTTTIKF